MAKKGQHSKKHLTHHGKKPEVKKVHTGKGNARIVDGTGKKQDYKPYGKFKDKLQIIGDSLFAAGFDYVPSKDHHKFKHPTCRFCQTTFGKTPSDNRIIKTIVTTIKKMCLTQCVPQIPLDKLPAQFFTIRMAGLVDKDVEELFPEGSIKEITILDVLNEITKTVTLSAQIDRESREDLRRMADQKGITLGVLIEEMKEVYEKSQ